MESVDHLEAQQRLMPIAHQIATVGDRLKTDIHALEGAAGNISVCLMGFPRIGVERNGSLCTEQSLELPFSQDLTIVITGSGRALWGIERENVWSNLCIVQIYAGESLYRIFAHQEQGIPTLRPTSEKDTHLTLHRYWVEEKNQKQSVVIHAQPRELVLLTHTVNGNDPTAVQKLRYQLFVYQPETLVLIPEGPGFVPYMTPGNPKIANHTLSEVEKGHRIIIWAGHGVIAVDTKLASAHHLIELIEAAAWYLRNSMTLVQQPPGLSALDLHDLVAHFKLPTTGFIQQIPTLLNR